MHRHLPQRSFSFWKQAGYAAARLWTGCGQTGGKL